MICRAVRLRSDQSFKLMIQVPEFEPRPSVRTSYPANEVTENTSSIPFAIFSSSWDLAFVYSSVEPGGVWSTA